MTSKGITSEPAYHKAVYSYWLTLYSTTLDHDSALLQMHQLQSEVEALRSCRAQEAVQTARGKDPLQLQGQEPLVSAIPRLGLG